MKEAEPSWFWPKHVTRGTAALNNFVGAQVEIVGEFLFTTELASRADHMRNVAAAALMKTLGPEDPKRADYEATLAKPDRTAKALASFRRINSENLINNTVNAFTRYVSEIIQACIIKQPRVLTSEDQVPVKSIIGLTRMTDVIQVLVERRVNKLSYGRISDTADYIQRHLGLSLFQDPDLEAWAMLAVEVRNINVHNGGIVNAVFLDRIQDRRGVEFVAGQRHHTDWDLYVKFAEAMVQTACQFDKAAAAKFKLAVRNRNNAS